VSCCSSGCWLARTSNKQNNVEVLRTGPPNLQPAEPSSYECTHDDNIINSDNSSSVCTYSNTFKASYHSCQSVMTFVPLVFVVDIVVYMYQKVVQDTTVYPVPLQGCVCCLTLQ
jgi:hypothetical protein